MSSISGLDRYSRSYQPPPRRVPKRGQRHRAEQGFHRDGEEGDHDLIAFSTFSPTDPSTFLVRSNGPTRGSELHESAGIARMSTAIAAGVTATPTAALRIFPIIAPPSPAIRGTSAGYTPRLARCRCGLSASSETPGPIAPSPTQRRERCRG